MRSADRGYFSSDRENAGITVTLPKPMTSGIIAKGRFGRGLPLCRGGGHLHLSLKEEANSKEVSCPLIWCRDAFHGRSSAPRLAMPNAAKAAFIDRHMAR